VVEHNSTYYGRLLSKARDGYGTSYPLYTEWRIGNSIDATTLVPVDLEKTHKDSLIRMIADLTKLISSSTLKKYHKILTNILENVKKERDKRNSIE